MLTRAHKPANRSIARGEQKAGTRRLGQQRLYVDLTPHVVHYDQRGLPGDGGAVPVLTGPGSVIAAEVVAQRLGYPGDLMPPRWDSTALLLDI